MLRRKTIMRAARNRGLARLFSIGALVTIGALPLMAAVTAGGENPANGKMTRWSDQFVVHDTRRYGRSLASFADADKPNLVQLELNTLLISAQRVRDSLARSLGTPALGGGKIRCYLYAPRGNNENILFLSTLHPEGWQYSLQIPDDVDRMKLVRGLVQALLTEIANRGTAAKSSEIPTWLIEGLAGCILGEIGPGLVLDGVPPNALRRATRETRGADYLAETREFFRNRQPLSISELSESPAAALAGEALARYRFSAQLLAAQLLDSEDGRLKMMRMLRSLPECWNWQTAFLRAYGFERMLDAEKWWWVETAAFTGFNRTRFFSESACLLRLEEMLRAPAQVRLSTNTLPVRVEAPLTQVVSTWGYAEQRKALQQKLAQLSALRASATRDVAPLIDGYVACLSGYLKKRDLAPGGDSSKAGAASSGQLLAREAMRELEQLDLKRTALRQSLAATTTLPAPEEP